MNIFVLDRNPAVAATMLCDKHVVKMIVETAQMLCTAAHTNGYVNTPYRPHRLRPLRPICLVISHDASTPGLIPDKIGLSLNPWTKAKSLYTITEQKCYRALARSS